MVSVGVLVWFGSGVFVGMKVVGVVAGVEVVVGVVGVAVLVLSRRQTTLWTSGTTMLIPGSGSTRER